MSSTHLSNKTRMKTRIETLATLLTVGLVIGTFPLNGRATDDPLAAIPFDDADPAVGRDINEVCAGCHGEYGQGGKDGEYPRLAGMPAAFVARQLLLFRDRARTNLAMVEYVDHRQMPDEDIAHIAVYLAGIELPSRLPPADESAPGFDAYQRLLDSKRVIQIPIAPGDTAAGEKIYRRECDSCHGADGMGKTDEAVPMLAGQYTNYLERQVEKYNRRQRIHDPDDPDDDLLASFTAEELRDVFAYLSILDD